MEEKKRFIPPKYTDTNFDSDIDDEDEDDIFDEEDETDQKLESYLDKEHNKSQQNNKKTTMQSTPFGQSVNQGTSQWNSPTPGSSWGNNLGNNNPWNQRPWGQPSSGSSWSNPWGASNNNPWGGSNVGVGGTSSFNMKRESIDRTKKVIFCDLLDCLIETFQSNGKPGLLPRGVYDIRLRFEVWDKLKCFGAEKIYVTTPKLNFITNNGTDSWVVLMNYVVCSLSEYLRVPFSNCQIISQSSIGQDKRGLIEYIISGSNYDKSDVLMIGLSSGLVGQSDLDKLIADSCKIDYIDLGQLMSMYF